MAASERPERTARAAERAPYTASVPQFWSVTDGYEYALHECGLVDADWVTALRRAAEDAYRIYMKVAPLAAALDATSLRDMGFPASVAPLLGDTIEGHPTLFGRFDFIETVDGFRMIEFNAETPFFWMETHVINGLACAAAGRDDPNSGLETAVIEAMRRYAHDADLVTETFAVTASNVYREDYWTARYLADLWSAALGQSVPVSPVHELRIRSGGLWHGERRIDVLHRLYPLEHVANDRYGAEFIALVRDGALRIVNPGAALFAQNKMTQVLIWNLRDRGGIFDEDDRATIERVFLPTSADAQAAGMWIRKPVFGREGTSVTLLHDGAPVRATRGGYDTQPMIYQQFASGETIAFRTSDGEEHRGNAVATCAIVRGSAGAVGRRVGGAFVDGWAHFQPLAMLDAKRLATTQT